MTGVQTEAAAFTAAIRERPNDLLPWSVFADWLSERGYVQLETYCRRREAELRGSPGPPPPRPQRRRPGGWPTPDAYRRARDEHRLAVAAHEAAEAARRAAVVQEFGTEVARQLIDGGPVDDPDGLAWLVYEDPFTSNADRFRLFRRHHMARDAGSLVRLVIGRHLARGSVGAVAAQAEELLRRCVCGQEPSAEEWDTAIRGFTTDHPDLGLVADDGYDGLLNICEAATGHDGKLEMLLDFAEDDANEIDRTEFFRLAPNPFDPPS